MENIEAEKVEMEGIKSEKKEQEAIAANSKIVVYDDPKSPAAEAYRSIRTSIQFANIDQTVKTIAITSSKAAEGKTTVAANLAASLSLLGNKVAIIDCDFRKPSVHRIFGVSNKKGVTDILLSHDEDDYGGYIRKIVGSDIDIITAGQIPSNPSEILSSKSMKSFLRILRENYDYVMIDTPPVGIVTDASVISSYIDGVIVVCNSGQVEIGMAKAAKQNLEKVNARILGIVLNNFKSETSKSSYYYE
ncbi:tyrosine-protein kinase YwqD [Peptoclostridium acidaminophilum DSM 3953]|uniref:non-specific protein-tyrosine kinase n=1 Tax=Peptoclostridium acidaminophilum DSM 3953 TaxID=1286171 RepID=W8T8J5_PEPAC|nr:CpsD/CapB family tyrosine-protein kinase [Peptoclostridium acidaminophilum]AHM57175.1 tyrosine-protein kinase YwqD [Peptoclostridium acidaminophilum DSM 3953]